MATTDLKTNPLLTHQLPLYAPTGGAVNDPNAYGRYALDDIKSLFRVQPSALDVRVVTVTGSVLATDYIIIIDASAGNVDLTFLGASISTAKSIKVARASADPGTYTVTLLPPGGQTIAGGASVALLPGEGYEFIPDGVSNYIQFQRLSKRVENIPAAEAITGSSAITNIYVSGRASSGDGYAGHFYWYDGDASTSVALDTYQGIFIAPSSDPTGASGAWIRSYDGPINIVWFGVTGDGVTDYSARVQSCLDLMPNEGVDFGDRTGGRVILPDGSYILNDVTPRPGTTIEGVGWNTEVRSTTATYGSLYLLNVTGPATTIRNIHFHTGGAGTQTAIRTYNANGITIQNCWFNGYTALDLKSITDVIVTDNFFDGVTNPIIIGTSGGGDNPFGITISGNMFFNNANPIKAYAINNSSILNNYFYKFDDIAYIIDVVTSGGLSVKNNNALTDGTASSASSFMYAENSTGIDAASNYISGTIKNTYYWDTVTNSSIHGGTSSTSESGIFFIAGTNINISGGNYTTTGNAPTIVLNGELINVNGVNANNSYVSGVTRVIYHNSNNSVFANNIVSATLSTNGIEIPTGKSGNTISFNKVYGAITNDIVDTDQTNYISKLRHVKTFVINPGLIAGSTTYTSSQVFIGAQFGDRILVAAPYDLSGMLAGGYVSSTNNVVITVLNLTGGDITLGSGAWTVTIER